MRCDRRTGPVAGGGGSAGGRRHVLDPPPPTPPARDASVIWHEAECGSYAEDLRLWEELASEQSGSILELGCGVGRVSMYLAQRGYAVCGLDSDAKLIAALADAELGDARDFQLDRAFGLVLAPMQLVQLLSDAGERKACLECVAGHLTPGGLAAFAIVEEMPEPTDAAPPLPDTREVDGWVYSSLPIETLLDPDSIRVRRLRQAVSPAGELSEEVDEVVLRTLDAATLEAEARRVGLRPVGRRTIPPTTDHVGSTVVLLEREF